MVGMLLLAAITLQQSPTATFSYDSRSNPVVKYRAGSKVHVLKEESSDFPHGGDAISRAPQEGLVVRGTRYEAKGSRIVNALTGQSIEIPSQPLEGYDAPYAFRCKAALDLGKSMLWVFAWDGFDTSLEPSAKVEAFEVVERSGELKVLRRAELPGAGGYAWGLMSKRYGQKLLLSQPEGKITVFDLSAWREIRSLDLAGGAVISPSGNVYGWKDGELIAWDQRSEGWKTLRKDDCGPILGLIQTGFDDMLVCKERLVLAQRENSYALPPGARGYAGSDYRLFLKKKVCIGVVWGGPSGTIGVVLDPATLKPITPIVR